MNTMNLSNIPLDAVRAFLLQRDYHFGFVHGGHELWVKENMVRPVVLRAGFDPVPEFMIRNILRSMDVRGEELEGFVAARYGGTSGGGRKKDRKVPALL